jgi:hypothetical protein
MGDSSLAGDARWSGSYGVNLDYVARSHCSVEFISIDDIQVNTSASMLLNLSICKKVVLSNLRR